MKPKSALRSFLALAGSSLLAISSASAATYTWANSNVTGTPSANLDWFTGGPNTQGTWTEGDPVSSNLNTIKFFQDTTTALPNTATPSSQTVNLNNGGTAFQLDTLTLSGRGSGTVNANLTMNLTGDALNFSAATGTINLDAVTNTRTITYNVANNIQLGTASSATALTFTGNGSGTIDGITGTSAFNITGNITENFAGSSLIKSGTSTATISGNISVSGGLQVNNGTLILSGTNNTYSGTTTLSAGTLRGSSNSNSLNPASPFGTSSLALNGGTLELRALGSNNNNAETITFGNNVTVGANVAISATRYGGAVNNKTIAMGTLSIGANTLSVSGGNGFSLSFGATTLTGNATFNPNGGSATTLILGAISDGGNSYGITKSGSNVLQIIGNGSYTGTTTISGGTLQLGLAGATGSLTGTSGITNNGNITINRTNTFTEAADLNGKIISGTGGFTQAGTGITVLSLDHTYTGQTSISAGTLVVNKMANYGADSSIGWGTNGTSIAMGSNSALVYTGGGETTDRSITLTGSTGAANSVNVVNNGTGALNFTATQFNTGTGNTNNRVLTLGGTNGGTISGAIRNTGASNQGYPQVIKNGTGTWTMAGSNNYAGDTTLNAGTLRLDYTTNNDSKLSDLTGSNLDPRFNGGTLELYGGSHTEIIGNLVVNGGTTFIKRTNAPDPAPASTSILQMGTISFSGGAIDFSADNIATTSTGVTNGILNVRATVAGANFAMKSGSNIVAYDYAASGSTGYTGGAMSATTNYLLTSNAANSLTATTSGNTLKIANTAAGGSLAVGNGQTLTLTAILFAGSANYDLSTSGTGKITPTLLHNYGTNGAVLNLGALGGALTQYGTGTTVLNGTATTDSGINIFGGTVQFSDNLQIGTNATAKAIALNNGTLRANTTNGNIALNSSGNLSRTVTLGAGGGTLDVIGGNKLTVSGVISSATATQLPTLTIGSGSSDGTIALTGTNTYTGRTFISGGTLSVGTIGNGGVAGNLGQASNVAYNIVFDGGTLAHTGASEVSDRAFTINSGKTATINTTNNLSLVGATGPATTGALTKTGAGTLTLTGTSTYTGTTTVSAGTLAVTGTGSINSTFGITIASGAGFKYNSSTALTAPITNNGGTISGTGTIGVAVNLNSTSDIIAPGNSPGIQNYGVGQTWSSFSYEWETNNFTGTTAGTDFDQIQITGGLDLNGAVAGSYILDLISLTALNAAGNVPNFSEVNRSWDILTATGGITGFNASYWTIDHSTGLNTFTSSPAWGGSWSLSLNDTAGTDSLVLTYTAVPEPGAALIGSLGLLALLRRRR